jgi:hypothetical protein
MVDRSGWSVGVVGLVVGVACSAAGGSTDASGGAGTAPAGGGAAGSDGAGVPLGGGAGSEGGVVTFDVASGGSAGTVDIGDSGCATYTDEAKQSVVPADIVWAVDTSQTMMEEAQAVQANINAFSQQIMASGVDVHVVMLAMYPIGFFPGICVPPPLGSGQCPTPNNSGVSDTKLPNFWHHPNAIILSVDAAAKLVALFPDYKFMLRPGVPKYLVVVTDDDSRNNANSAGNAGKYDGNPTAFVHDYTALDPMMTDGSGGRMWKLSAVYAFSQCANAANVGTFWKQVVNVTGGVHGDICNCPPGQAQSCQKTFQKILDELAKKIITGSKPLACAWAIPPPEPGKMLEPGKVNVEFVDKAKGTSETIYRVEDASKCDPTLGGWYYDNNQVPTMIHLCPGSCSKVTGAVQGSKINVIFGCATKTMPK